VRTTIDLPADSYERIKLLATERHLSVSETVVELVVRALASMESQATVSTDPRTGLPTLTVGRRITAEEVAAAFDG
jgi:hypothetical protein